MPDAPEFPFVYSFRRRALFGPQGCPLYGKACRILVKGGMNSVMVEFETGERHIVSRNALREPKKRAAPTLFD